MVQGARETLACLATCFQSTEARSRQEQTKSAVRPAWETVRRCSTNDIGPAGPTVEGAITGQSCPYAIATTGLHASRTCSCSCSVSWRNGPVREYTTPGPSMVAIFNLSKSDSQAIYQPEGLLMPDDTVLVLSGIGVPPIRPAVSPRRCSRSRRRAASGARSMARWSTCRRRSSASIARPSAAVTSRRRRSMGSGQGRW